MPAVTATNSRDEHSLLLLNTTEATTSTLAADADDTAAMMMSSSKMLATRWNKVRKYAPYDRFIMSLYGVGVHAVRNNNATYMMTVDDADVEAHLIQCIRTISLQLPLQVSTTSPHHADSNNRVVTEYHCFLTPVQTIFLLICRFIDWRVYHDFPQHLALASDTQIALKEALFLIASSSTNSNSDKMDKIVLNFLKNIYFTFNNPPTTTNPTPVTMNDWTSTARILYVETPDIATARDYIENKLIRQFLELKSRYYDHQEQQQRLPAHRGVKRKLFDLNNITFTLPLPLS